jgi:biopolymer transport protein TolQ
MEQSISIWHLVTNASLFVQIILAVLLIFSIVSWGIIINKWLALIRIKVGTYMFLRNFKGNDNIASLFDLVKNKNERNTSVAAMFYYAIEEYNKIKQQNINQQNIILNNIERSINSVLDYELHNYESGLSLLATFGSVSPYIGLLGTVWGIMHAFIGLGVTGQATLNSVAPGIAEALIATAFGLFVAIPSYIFYNKFINDVQNLNSSMTKFGDDLLNLINRKLLANNNDN